MHINNVVIKNFRALEDIHCEFNRRINVIVGPNAIGKTTVLQALRVVKGLLAARSQQEAQQTLISLGAASPNLPQRLFVNALARDVSREVEIRCAISLTKSEVKIVSDGISGLIQTIVMAQAGQSFANPTSLLQFLSSPHGLAASERVRADIKPFIDRIEADQPLIMGLTISPQSGQVAAVEPLAGAIIGFLDQRLPPNLSLFSYFPADRALPFGEQPVQLGAADSQQQLESHNSQPQTKYSRMKHMIFSSIVMGDDSRRRLLAEFEKIFDGILRGRKISSVGINEIGMLSVVTEEIATGRKVELDNLSSGEKNLILTFLLISHSIAQGGVALFDDPELHLNPAVCRSMLDFMLKEYSIPYDIQFIICTHSPEILAGAFGNDDCSLYHIKTPTLITKVGRHAIDEYSEALRQLGTSVSESLLYEGTLIVEGDDDVEFFEYGFGDILKRYKVRDRGGRKEVEKAAKRIQELERKGEKVSPIYIVIDRDDEVTDLKSSEAVGVLQWPRRCMENYLIDIEVITMLMKQPSIARHPVGSQGEVDKLLRNLALGQLNRIAALEVYRSYGYKNPKMWGEDVEKAPIAQIASYLYERLVSIRDSIVLGERAVWEADFAARCEARRRELELIWETSWKSLCDGKMLFSDLQKTGCLRVGPSLFKRMIVQGMRDSASENWRLVESLLRDLLKTMPTST